MLRGGLLSRQFICACNNAGSYSMCTKGGWPVSVMKMSAIICWRENVVARRLAVMRRTVWPVPRLQLCTAGCVRLSLFSVAWLMAGVVSKISAACLFVVKYGV